MGDTAVSQDDQYNDEGSDDEEGSKQKPRNRKNDKEDGKFELTKEGKVLAHARLSALRVPVRFGCIPAKALEHPGWFFSLSLRLVYVTSQFLLFLVGYMKAHDWYNFVTCLGIFS